MPRIKMVAGLCVVIVALGAAAARAENGTISGTISDAASGRLLAGAAVEVPAATLKTTADANGYFVFNGVPGGVYVVKAFLVGYRPVAQADVVVNPGRRAVVNLKMEAAIAKGTTVIRAEDYFAAPADIAVSEHSLNYEEIRRQPGGAGDIQRVLATMPGVGSVDINSDLIVRGGDPQENLYLLDNIEVFNPVHFGQIDGWGGVISALNLEMLDGVEFLTGGFPAKYGDKASAVMDVTFRDGDREKWGGTADMSFMGLGGLVEGPVGADASVIFGARQSLLQILNGVTDFGFGSEIPKYQNFTGKASWDAAPRHRLSVTGFYAVDRIADVDEDLSVRDDSGDYFSDQDAFGLNWRWLFSPEGSTTVTLSRAANAWSWNGRSRDVIEAAQTEYAVRGEISYYVIPAVRFAAGSRVKSVAYDIHTEGPAGYTDTGEPYTNYDDDFALDSYKAAGWVETILKPVETLAFTLGGRGGRFGYAGRTALAPRVAARWEATPGWAFNAAVGRYYETPPYSYYRAAKEAGATLEMSYADHYVAGASYLLTSSARAGAEVFYKDMARLPVSGFENGENVVRSSGTGAAYGGELYVHQKLEGAFFARGAYSYGRSTRIERAGAPEYLSDYDQTHSLTAVAGVELGKNWLVSGKFKIATNRPYTPVIGRWTLPFRVEEQKQPWFRIDGPVNSARYPVYHRLDLRVDKRWYGSTWSLTTYFDAENVYNRHNVAVYSYSDEFSRIDPVYAFGIMPVLGVEFSF
jgi:hypothetical protein